MAIGSGLAAQLGVKAESTYGTGVVVDRFYEFTDESLGMEIQRIESAGRRAGTFVQRSDRWAAGRKTVGGDVTIELVNKSMGLLFNHALGTISTSALVDSAYTHTITPGTLFGKSLTAQVGKPDVNGTVQPFTYEGCKVASWELMGSVGEIGKLKLNLVGEDETTATALATASYPASLSLLTFTQATLTIAGSAVNVRSASIGGDNGLKADRFFLGSALTKEPIESGMRSYTGKLDADFESLTAYNRFINGTEAALVLAWTGNLIGATSRFKVEATCNVRFDGETPKVGGPEITELPLPFKCVDSGAGANTAISLAYVTTDLTP